MPNIEALINQEDARIELLRGGDTDESAACVLLWISRSQRAYGNLAVNVAVELADKLELPVLAVFCLTAYPSATLRPYAFMVEGLEDVGHGLAKRKIGWIVRAGAPPDVIPQLAKELNAALIVGDQAPDRTGRGWRTEVAGRISIPMLTVDADVVVPSSLFPKEEWAPRTIRPKIDRVLDDYLRPMSDPVPRRHAKKLESPNLTELLDSLDIDRSVGTSPRFKGGQTVARRELHHFVDHRLANYDTDRNRSDISGSSNLSPYLHFGHISSLEVAFAVRNSGAEAAAIDAYIDEVIVNRELTVNFALRNPNYDTFDGIPDWGKTTLAKHAGDPRPVIYTRAELEAGRTDDPIWNACQRQMVREGYLPNRLRMYWAKQLPLWTKSAEDAFAIAVALNDRYFIDGRDPSGYAGIAWSIGGRHDRPFPPDRPITGLVRRMGVNALKKHFNPQDYIDQWPAESPTEPAT